MNKSRCIAVTLAPLLFMTVVTFSAGYMKIFSLDPKIGFISGARSLLVSGSGIANASKAADLARQAAVWRFDAFVAAFFLLLVLLIVIGSAAQWYRLLAGNKVIQLHESKFVSLAELARTS